MVIESATLWFAGWCSIHWASPARAHQYFFLISSIQTRWNNFYSVHLVYPSITSSYFVSTKERRFSWWRFKVFSYDGKLYFGFLSWERIVKMHGNTKIKYFWIMEKENNNIWGQKGKETGSLLATRGQCGPWELRGERACTGIFSVGFSWCG